MRWTDRLPCFSQISSWAFQKLLASVWTLFSSKVMLRLPGISVRFTLMNRLLRSIFVWVFFRSQPNNAMDFERELLIYYEYLHKVLAYYLIFSLWIRWLPGADPSSSSISFLLFVIFNPEENNNKKHSLHECWISSLLLYSSCFF